MSIAASGGALRRRGAQQGGPVPDEIVFAVDGELVVLAHEDRRHGAGFLAVAAEDAAHLVNLVDGRVPRSRHHGAVVFRRFEVNGIRRARHRAETARDALPEAVLVAHQHLLAAVLREHRHLLVRVVHRHLRLEHVPGGGPQAGQSGSDHPSDHKSQSPNPKSQTPSPLLLWFFGIWRLGFGSWDFRAIAYNGPGCSTATGCSRPTSSCSRRSSSSSRSWRCWPRCWRAITASGTS